VVVFIDLDISSTGINEREIPLKLFMGFGYNPNLSTFGERLDILNFFSWMKQLQDEFSSGWFVYDASGYYIVNRTPKKKIDNLGNSPNAKQILEVLISEQDRPKRKEIINNCELRSQYLQRAINISRVNATYIDSRLVFREDSDYQDALDLSLEFVRRLQKEDLELVSSILPSNSNPASRLYLPLEIAEALYLKNRLGVSGKFGPSSEELFDQSILRLFKEIGISYQTVRCSSGPRKPGYLSDRNVIWTRFPDNQTVYGLLNDRGYKKFVETYLVPFRNGKSLSQEVLELRRKLEGESLK